MYSFTAGNLISNIHLNTPLIKIFKDLILEVGYMVPPTKYQNTFNLLKA